MLIGQAGWLNQQRQNVIDYLVEENRVLRDQLGVKRPHLSDNQRRRLAVKAKKLGCQGGLLYAGHIDGVASKVDCPASRMVAKNAAVALRG